MLSWGPDQIVIVYVPRACTKKNLESISPIILVLGHIFLVFGVFGVFGRVGPLWGCRGRTRKDFAFIFHIQLLSMILRKIIIKNLIYSNFQKLPLLSH